MIKTILYLDLRKGTSAIECTAAKKICLSESTSGKLRKLIYLIPWLNIKNPFLDSEVHKGPLNQEPSSAQPNKRRMDLDATGEY